MKSVMLVVCLVTMFTFFLFLFFGNSKIPQKEITLKIDVTNQLKIADQKAATAMPSEVPIEIK